MIFNKLYLLIVYLFLLLMTCSLFWGLGAFGGEGAYGLGKIFGILEIVILFYLLVNARQFLRPTMITNLVLLWSLLVSISGAWFGFQDIMLTLGFVTVLLWEFVYLFFYAYSKNDLNSLKLLSTYFYLLSVLCCLLFFITYKTANMGFIGNETQLGSSYYCLLTLPWLLLAKKSWVRYAGMALVMLAVTFSLKRGGMLAFASAVLVYFAVEYVFSAQHIRLVRLIIPSVLFVLAIIAFLYIDKQRSGVFLDRLYAIRSDEGSGRIAIYENIYYYLPQESGMELLLGNGYNGSQKYLGESCHNDFFEVLFNYGIVGLIIYMMMHLTMILRVVALIRKKSPLASAYAVSYVIFFVLTMISHLIIYPTYFIYLVAFWGSVEGHIAAAKTNRKGRISPDHIFPSNIRVVT